MVLLILLLIIVRHLTYHWPHQGKLSIKVTAAGFVRELVPETVIQNRTLVSSVFPFISTIQSLMTRRLTKWNMTSHALCKNLLCQFVTQDHSLCTVMLEDALIVNQTFLIKNLDCGRTESTYNFLAVHYCVDLHLIGLQVITNQHLLYPTPLNAP